MRAHRCGVGLVCLPLLVGCAMGGTYSHSLKTSADLQRDLEDCNKAARWAMDRGHIPSGTFADYLRYVDWCLLGKHGWRKIEGPGIIKGVMWTAAATDNALNVLESTVVEKVNEFVAARCDEVKDEWRNK